MMLRTPALSCLTKIPSLIAFLLIITAVLPAQTVNTIVNFNGTNGSTPFFMQFVQGRDGRLYGTTYNGGANNMGAVIRINLTTNNSIVLHSFSGTDGANPGAGLTLATDGNFYGTTVMGGSADVGVLYKINSAGTYTVLHQFAGGSDGSYPYAPPILGNDGSLYGATSGNLGVPATIYKLTSAGVYSVVYEFSGSGAGYGIYGIMQGSDGLLYAGTNVGGTSNCGTLVKLTTTGTVKGSHNFNCSSGGAYPVSAPFQASDGNIYGTTQNGGPTNQGTLYRLSSSFGVNILYDFGSDGGTAQNPDTALMQATDGNLYGVTYYASGGGGTIYSWSLAGNYTQVYTFANPYFTGGLMQDTSGVFYGTSQLGGTNDDGYVYSFNNGLGPFIAFVRAQGHPGATAQILGQGLTGTTAVSFNGVNATSFSVVSDTYMTAVVPSGATTGPVSVTTPGGALTSNVSFRMSQ